MKKSFVFIFALLVGLAAYAEPLKLTNVVCFVKFQDQDYNEWFHQEEGIIDPAYDWYEEFFNSDAEGVNSVRNYFRTMSYGRTDWVSHIVHFEYVDSHPSSYFKPKTSTNPNGYDPTLEPILDTRFKELVKNVCKKIEKKIGDDVLLDGNNDGEVDNLTIIINGSSAVSASQVLWPQNTRVTSTELKGVRVGNVLRVFDGYNGYQSWEGIDLNTGVVCHEMMHSLNAYDLYTSKSNYTSPVDIWDLMSDNQFVPQSLTGYMRNRYSQEHGGWIKDNEIVELTDGGTFVVRPLNSATPENVLYKIKPSKFNQEYFMIEYRDGKDIWDSQLPGTGLLVYRINPGCEGNLGVDPEVYIFRPDGSETEAGNIKEAPLGPEMKRTSFGEKRDSDYPFYSDGSKAKFSLANIRYADDGSGMEFTLTLNGSTGPSSAVDEIADDNILALLGNAPLSVDALNAAIDSNPGMITVFNMQGQRLEHVAIPGIYIINSRKFIVR